MGVLSMITEMQLEKFLDILSDLKNELKEINHNLTDLTDEICALSDDIEKLRKINSGAW